MSRAARAGQRRKRGPGLEPRALATAQQPLGFSLRLPGYGVRMPSRAENAVKRRAPGATRAPRASVADAAATARTESPPAATSSVGANSLAASTRGGSGAAEGDYLTPIVPLRLPAAPVNAAFWLGLAGAALVGAVDLPVAALLGAGVLVARPRRP
jgi:hypothetical protein